MTYFPPAPLLDDGGISRFREALTAANYTTPGLRDRLGPVAARMSFSDLAKYVGAMDDDDPTLTLFRLFHLGLTQPAAAVEVALRPLPLADAVKAGLIGHIDSGVRAQVLVRAESATPAEPTNKAKSATPAEPANTAESGWWLLSDLPWQQVHPESGPAFDHVLEFGPSSRLLARVTSRRPVDAALDLGTGSGIQAAHLSRHAKKVTGTDLSARALRFAATTAALNGLEWELLQGDLAEPVTGRQFDLVVFNAPFVVSPGEPQQMFRDSGRQADSLCAELIATAPKLLAPGGVMQFLAHWLCIDGHDWTARIQEWLAGTGLDALVLRLSRAEPALYVAQWLSTERPAQRPARATGWLDWFAANKVEAVYSGLITLRAGGYDDPTVRFIEAPLPPGQVGDHVVAIFDGCDLSRSLNGAAIWDARLRAADNVSLFRQAEPGPGGWNVKGQLLAADGGMGWKVPVDPTTATLVAACDGLRPLREYVDDMAVGKDVEPARLRDALEPTVHRLVERGILLPVEPTNGGDPM
jgi:methylase of polypeptide subunit release factors